MSTIAVYNLKGGVGKTTSAVNLAWLSGVHSHRRTLLWDLDAQGGATLLSAGEHGGPHTAQSLFARDVAPHALIRPSRFTNVDLLAADTSLRGLDRFLFQLGKKQRLAKLIADLSQDYDRIILDCPPGLTEISEQIMRAADLMIVPVIPSPLARAAFGQVQRYMNDKKARQAPMLPVFTMVDRRRGLHRAALADHPEWPVIPMASAVEQMGERGEPVVAFAPSSPASTAYMGLWRAIERRIARDAKRS